MAKLEMIRAFVVVTRHGNLRDAATELGRTQSALSMTLSQLEAGLGGPLFETDRKRDLTELGRFVRDIGADLLREHDRVQDIIYSYANGHIGRLRIASVPSVAALILPDILGTFMTRHSGAQIDLTDSDSANVRTLVAAGQADLGIAGETPTGKSLYAEPLFGDTLHVLCRVGSRFAARQDPLTWADLAEAPLIVNEAMSAATDPQARSVVATSKLSVRNIMSLYAMVGSGMGITVLPGLATRSLDPSLTAVPMQGPGSTRTISLLSRQDRTEAPLARALRTHLRSVMPDLITQFRLNPVDDREMPQTTR